jgi:diguanylate cyclase (GGDEF)-like protein
MRINMGIQSEDVVYESPQTTEEGKQELYLYSQKKIKDVNAAENYNSLTGLPTLRLFFYQTGEIVKDNPDDKFAVIVMDITQFKAVNEFCGRSEGDRLLKFIADCYREYAEHRPKTFVSHVRADNFCLFTAYDTEKELADIAVDLKKKIESLPFAYKVLPSFGICASTDSRPAVNYLKDCATIALSSIKGKFYADYKFFDIKMRTQLMREKQVESDIVAALKNGELVPYIQPKVNMITGRIVGGEALVRWVRPNGSVIKPAEFIPVLEKNGFVINVDNCVWEQIFKYLNSLLEAGRDAVPISINISRVHVYDKNLCDTLFELKDKYNVPSGYTPLELTESAFLTNEEGMYYRMKLLKAQGFDISMDDFGTGYSTMNMLKSQPVDEVKIDKEFIDDIVDEKGKIILEYTIKMLQALKVKILIEGVETEEQKEFLTNCGCYIAQGFLFYKPMPLEEFDRILREQELRDRSK